MTCLGPTFWSQLYFLYSRVTLRGYDQIF